MNLTEIPSDKPGYAMYQTVIEDTGIGMSEEFLPHLFEEFTRERSRTESKVGKGTKITVTLPHRIAEDGDAQNIIEKAHAFDENHFKGKRILLAEDNELNAEIAITILAMTANAFEEDKREAYRSGMNGHLSKPIAMDEVAKTIAGNLERKDNHAQKDTKVSRKG